MEALNRSGIEVTLGKLLPICSDLHFIKRVNRIFQYYDEPKFYQYSGEVYIDQQATDGHLRDKWKAGGSSMFSERTAFLKCLAESIERYSCMVYKKTNLKKGSFNQLKHKAVDPMLFSKFTEEQKNLKDFKRFIYDRDTPFTWVDAKSLITGRTKLVPAQLIYHNYQMSDKSERFIDIPISTGAAFSDTLSSAIVRGFLELVERDAFLIMYMNKLRCSKVNLSLIDDSRVEQMLDQMRRYKLEVNMIDITTDLGIPSFAAVVVNRTKVGPAIQVGIRSHFDPVEAIVGAFQESLHTRCWIRYLYENKFEKYKDINPQKINSFEERGLYWYDTTMIKKLDFWLKQGEVPLKYSRTKKTLSNEDMLARIRVVLKKHKYDAYFVDLTLPEIKSTGCKVVKVISPDLQPHCFNEQYKLLGGRRLSETPMKLGYKRVQLFNNIPNPFL